MDNRTPSPIAIEEESISNIDAHIDSLGLNASSSTTTENVDELTILRSKC